MDESILKLSDLNTEDILDREDKHFKLGDAKEKLNLLVTGAKDIVQYPNFWNELPHFCAKQYTTNKHLQVTNIHRAVVMKTLLAFLAREEISSEVKASVLTEAAKQVFKLTENQNHNEADSVIEIPVPWKKG